MNAHARARVSPLNVFAICLCRGFRLKSGLFFILLKDIRFNAIFRYTTVFFGCFLGVPPFRKRT